MVFHLIKKNPALAAGILLPVILVVLFSIADLLPRFMVKPPAYDLLFSMKSYSAVGEYEYKFSVEDHHLKWQMRRLPGSKGNGGYNYHVYWYEAASRTVHELPLETKKSIGKSWVTLPLEEVAEWEISPELTAPDGYRLHNDYKRTSDLGLLFFSGSQRSAIHIAKDSRIVSIYPPKRARDINTPEFIGWVLSKGDVAKGDKDAREAEGKSQ